VSRLHTSFVLGFHGCDREFGLKAVRGEVALIAGKSKFDWMGTGIYFWESDPHRALEWAQQKAARGACNEPFVIGAAIDLGNCLDLLVRENVELVKMAYESFEEVQRTAGLTLPENKKAPKDDSPDLVMRFLDCAVINHLHSIVEGPSHPPGFEPYDSVRAVFGEGDPIFGGSKLMDRNHVQIAVRNPKCIKGLFIPLDFPQSSDAASNPSTGAKPGGSRRR
jgi:hypothetical protein